MTVRQEPLGAVAGRVLDAAGKPRAGRKVVVMHCVEQKHYKGLPLELIFDYPWWTKLIDGEATTDDAGRFRIDGLVPGLRYSLNGLLASVQQALWRHVSNVPRSRKRPQLAR